MSQAVDIYEHCHSILTRRYKSQTNTIETTGVQGFLDRSIVTPLPTKTKVIWTFKNVNHYHGHTIDIPVDCQLNAKKKS